MTNLASRLRALQQADSFFPTGAAAWSWGLETLVAERRIGAPTRRATSGRTAKTGGEQAGADLLAFIDGQLRWRWASFDRAFLSAAWRSEGDQEHLSALDARMEALSPVRGLRDGSRRLGASLLGMHVELNTPGARSYQKQVLKGAAYGHLAIMQGLLWSGIGVSDQDCELAAAHSLCTGLVSAALRLGAIGHIEAQRVLRETEPAVLEVLGSKPPDIWDVYSFTPMEEIAVMRHDDLSPRLFSN